MFRLPQMGRQEVCVPQEVTVLWLRPLPSRVLLAPSATALASAESRTASAARQGNRREHHALMRFIFNEVKHVRKVKDSSLSNHRSFSILVSFYCLGFNNTAPSGLCLAGFFCTGGSDSPAQHEAQEGHYTWEGAAGPQQCPLGTFQPVGSSDVKLSDDEKV